MVNASEYRPRDIAHTMAEALRTLPVVVLTGMRQAGKTTFLQNQPELKGRRYFTLDNFATLEAARRDPESLLAGDEPVTIDEAQKVPELLTLIKHKVDKHRNRGQYLLSGSANFALLRGVSESLAGRALYLTLHPFSRREVLGWTDRKPFLKSLFEDGALKPHAKEIEPVSPQEIQLGGMPPVCLNPDQNHDLWFDGFEQTYLERDLRDLSQVADLSAFRRLMRLAALRTGHVLNQSELARDAQLPNMTTKRYLDLLETSFVIQKIPPFIAGNRSSRVMKSPKLVFEDSGLAAFLAGAKDLSDANEPMRGSLLETYVAQNLSSILMAHWHRAKLHYWRTTGRYEVDFVIEDGRDCLAIEIKSGTRWTQDDLIGLRAFLDQHPRCRRAVLAHNGKEVASLGDRMVAVPISLLLA